MSSSRRGRYLALLPIYYFHVIPLQQIYETMFVIVVALFHYQYCYLYHIMCFIYIYHFLSGLFKNLISTKTTDA